MRIRLLIGIFLFGLTVAAHAAPDKRVALVIGNNAYKELHALENPGADAESIAQLLAERGFDTISCDGKRPGCFDLTRDGLSAAIAQLKTKSQDAALALVFYAGHGMEAAEGNVLVPIDADVDCERHQVARGVLVDEVLEALSGAAQKIVVLDACRNNPLGEVCPPATKAKLTFRDFKVPDAGNFLLVSSTKPGQVADDGLAGAHSPFARALLAALSGTPNVHFDQVFNRVSKTVIEETSKGNFTQIPEMLIRGGAPETCLAGEACAADPRAAALAEELEALKRDRARDQELGETAKEYLAQIERQRGKPLSEDERRQELASLRDATRSLAARNDNRGERALDKLKTGDTGEAEKLFQEDLDLEQSEEKAEAQRLAARRKKAAASARNIAALARWKDVAKAVAYYKRAVDLDPDDAKTWSDYARAAKEAGRTDEAKAAFAQAALKATGKDEGGIRYWALNGQGDVAMLQGHLQEALQLYRSAQEMITELSAQAPSNTEWRRDLGWSHLKIGDVLVSQGNFAGALQLFRESLAILEDLAKEDPNNTLLQSNLSFMYNRVGAAIAPQDSSQSLQFFRKSVAVADRLAQADPSNVSRQWDLSASLGFVAIILEWQHDLAGASEYYNKEAGMLERLTKADPGNGALLHDLARTYQNFGDVLAKQENRAEALRRYQESQAIFQRLTTGDPSNVSWRIDLAGIYGKMGQFLVSSGEPAQAMQAFRQDLAIVEPLAPNAPASGLLNLEISSAHRELGNLLLSQGKFEEALQSFRTALAAAERIVKFDPNNKLLGVSLAQAYDRVADLQTKHGDPAQAMQAYRESIAIRSRLAEADSDNTDLQRDLAATHTKLAYIHLKQNEFALAEDEAGKAKLILEPLRRLSPDNADWARFIATIDATIVALPAKAAFEAGQFSKAAATQLKLAEAQEKAEREKAGKPGPGTANALLELAWFRLFARDFKGALAASDRAAALSPDPIYVTNKAHALMFLGRSREARALYRYYKSQRVVKDGKLWEEGILGDFEEFEKRGLKHRQMAEIKTLLAAK
jgi:tetratricopeptide (TPR) repeat protein